MIVLVVRLYGGYSMLCPPSKGDHLCVIELNTCVSYCMVCASVREIIHSLLYNSQK